MGANPQKAGETLATSTSCSTKSQAVPLLLKPCFIPSHEEHRGPRTATHWVPLVPGRQLLLCWVRLFRIKAKGSGSCPTLVSYKSRVHCCIWFQPVGEVCCLHSCKAGRQSSPEGISNLFGLKGSAKPEDISAPSASPHSPYSGKQLSLGRESSYSSG